MRPNWVIDRDYLTKKGEPYCSIGVLGDIEAPAPARGEGYRFRLLDDDGNVYYGGRYNAEALTGDDLDEGSLYSALSWAMHDSGCTALQVRLEDFERLYPGRDDDWLDRYVRPHATKDGWYTPFG